MSAFNYAATYYKFIGEPKEHCSKFPYKVGLNQLSDNDGEQFNPKPICGPGGMYFTDAEHILGFLEYGEILCTIKVPEDARVVKVGSDRYKCDKFTILSMKRINTNELNELLECGARLYIRSYSPQYLLRYRPHIIRMLCRCDIPHSIKCDFLETVVCDNKFELTKHIITEGSYSSTFLTLLLEEFISKHDNTKIVKFLIKSGADINADGGRALCAAAAHNRLNTLKLLLRLGATQSSIDEALVTAAETGHIEIVEFLLSAGASVHAQDGKAVKCAYINKKGDVVDCLRRAGADDPAKVQSESACAIL